MASALVVYAQHFSEPQFQQWQFTSNAVATFFPTNAEKLALSVLCLYSVVDEAAAASVFPAPGAGDLDAPGASNGRALSAPGAEAVGAPGAPTDLVHEAAPGAACAFGFPWTAPGAVLVEPVPLRAAFALATAPGAGGQG